MPSHAGVWNGSHICVDPLSDPVSLLPVPRDPKYGVAKVAHVLTAIDLTIHELTEYYSKPDEESKGQYFCSCSLGQLQNMKKMNNIEWLFEAECNGKKVAVKFVRTFYGEDVHKLLAKHELAPQLFSVTPLDGGWLAVVMEAIEGAPLRRPAAKPVEEALKRAVSLMHTNGYVHGDVRPQNVLVSDNTVRIVDFDWAGKHPNARYPPELNMDCNWLTQ